MLCIKSVTNNPKFQASHPSSFQLTHNSVQASGNNSIADEEYSIFVTDLPENSTDHQSVRKFASRFNFIKMRGVC